jgi:hypothetical protein
MPPALATNGSNTTDVPNLSHTIKLFASKRSKFLCPPVAFDESIVVLSSKSIPKISGMPSLVLSLTTELVAAAKGATALSRLITAMFATQ